MSMVSRFASLFAGAALCAVSAAAYDGPIYVHVPAPVLKMARNTEIHPRSTTIRMSRQRVEIEYRLAAGAKDAVHYLYVPLGNIDTDHAGNADAFSGDPAVDPIGLKATLDDMPVSFALAARATFEGLDISDILRKAGMPLSPFGAATDGAAGKLPADVRRELDERGVLGKWGALWTLETAYWRRQEFAAGKPSVLKLSYKPVVGAYINSLLMMRGKLVYSLEEEKLDFLCLKPDQLAEIHKRFRARKGERPYRPYRIYDITMKLENANPQYGSIYELDFTVDMRRAGDMLATCGGKFRRTSPTQYAWKEDVAEETPGLKLFFLETVTAEEEVAGEKD